MGIKDFSKTFLACRQVKMKDLKGKTIAIDAMTEIYRSALGAKSVSTLTDKYGNPTLHISVILANVIEMQKQGVNQIWIFDYDKLSGSNEEFHNPAKVEELLKRKIRKDVAKEKLSAIALFDSVKNNKVVFSDGEDGDGDDDDDTQPKSKSKAKSKPKSTQKDSLEKQMFSATSDMINDVKLILNCLCIRYIEAPAGFEGEHIAAYLSATDQVDAVYSGDTDPIPFGAKILYRKNPRDKKIYEYTQDDILRQIKEGNETYADEPPTLHDLRKACVAMGSDFAPKTPRIGAKTMLKKLHTIKLTKKQEEAMVQFSKEPNTDIDTYNLDKESFVDCNVDFLVNWLVEERSFTKSRVLGWLKKVLEIPE